MGMVLPKAVEANSSSRNNFERIPSHSLKVLRRAVPITVADQE